MMEEILRGIEITNKNIVESVNQQEMNNKINAEKDQNSSKNE